MATRDRLGDDFVVVVTLVLRVHLEQDPVEVLVEEDRRRAVERHRLERVDHPTSGVRDGNRLVVARVGAASDERLVRVTEEERDGFGEVAVAFSQQLAAYRALHVFPQALLGPVAQHAVGVSALPLDDVVRDPIDRCPHHDVDRKGQAFQQLMMPALGQAAHQVVDDLFGRIGVLETVVGQVHVDARAARTTERRPEEVDPGEVLRFPVPHLEGWWLPEHHAGRSRHEPVDRFGVVPVMEDHRAGARVVDDAEVRIDGVDTDVREALVALDQRGEEHRGHRRVVGLGQESGRMPRRRNLHPLRQRTKVIGVVTFPGPLPQVMIVIPGDEVHRVGEHPLAVRQREFHEPFEDHGRDIVGGQRELEDVAAEHERRPFPSFVGGDELSETLDEIVHHRAGDRRIHRGRTVDEFGEDAVLRAEVQVGQDHVADVGHRDSSRS